MPNGKMTPALKPFIEAQEKTLMPCPFCGSQAEIENTHTPHYWVQCLFCEAEVSSPTSYIDESNAAHKVSILGAVGAWNKRV